MAAELPTQYDPKLIEGPTSEAWLGSKAFAAAPDDRSERYVIMMPLPNVTGSLHMGHALDNVMQDLLIRWNRMQGRNTLWMPGTDHAGIATQAVIEKRLFELEGRTRHDIGREALVERIWAWKQEYEKRITRQQQAMGCSCDWDRQRFTMDRVYAPAVREMFFRLYRDGLIVRGNRLVNWDCHLQTAVADDEVEHAEVDGRFWHFRYPVLDPKPGEPDHVLVATTRPETMLGDTAVAVHPEPRTELVRQIEAVRDRLAGASAKERAELEKELGRLEERERDLLPRLEQLVAMARDGRRLRLPIVDREIPLVLDEWAKPGLGSGCVKVTPAHDPNDYEVWRRQGGAIGIVNLLEPDGTYNANAGPFAGQDRFVVRKGVVRRMEELGLCERVEARKIEIGHSDRSKTPVEPYLSKQWYVRMGDLEGGVVLGRGTDKEFRAPGLAQACIDAVSPDGSSASGRRLVFHPDADRYARTYASWLGEKRDWCISRQLWWGHRIPIWHLTVLGSELADRLARLTEVLGLDLAGVPLFLAHDPRLSLEGLRGWCFVEDPEGAVLSPAAAAGVAAGKPDASFNLQLCLRDDAAEQGAGEVLAAAGFTQDPDVLDTWFSSQLFPFATLGWPDPAAAEVGPGQTPLGPDDQGRTALAYYYPGSCLVTGRDIITLWVARMVLAGLYVQGELPFTDCFIHANIQDGKGERMSKSKGNGIDPIDIIDTYGADAMRYVMCDMQTGMQDIRLPVMAVSPYTGKQIDLTHARHGRSVFTYIDPDTGKEFDVLGTFPELPNAKILSERFEVGRNFCNKLWNAARLVLMNLGDLDFAPLDEAALEGEDRWIRSRLGQATAEVTRWLAEYNPSAAINVARDFFWNDLCDWYLELIKPRLRDEARAPVARRVLAAVFDQVLRLLHPFLPFVTEHLWQQLGAQAPARGFDRPFPGAALLVHADWPEPGVCAREPGLEAEFARLQEVLRAVRDLRAKYEVAPSERVTCVLRGDQGALASLELLSDHLVLLGRLGCLDIGGRPMGPAAVQVVGEVEVHLLGVLDPDKERARLGKQQEHLSKGIDGVRRKLSSQGFVQRAPAAVVETERARLAELEAELARVQALLDGLS